MNTRSFLSTTALALATAITLNACSSDDSSDNNSTGGGASSGGGTSSPSGGTSSPSGNSGTITVTDIPTEYNGKYALIFKKGAPASCGGESIQLIGYNDVNASTRTFYSAQISNGKVSSPLWCFDANNYSAVRYSGNEAFIIRLYILTRSEFVNNMDVNTPYIIAGGRSDNEITFSNGSATISANDMGLTLVDTEAED